MTPALAHHHPLKIVVVGDGTVGKTCLLLTYTTGIFPTEYIPTVFDNFTGTITVDKLKIYMTLWDTAGQENYQRLRPLSYPQTDVFILCYSVDDKQSYDNVAGQWWPEVRHYCPRVPVVLVATKMDLRKRNSLDSVSTHDGKRLCERIRAEKYVECSAKTCSGLEEVFREAVRAVLRPKSVVRKMCVIL